ncbi:hypothetical protein KGS77_28810 [Streptomyces sp. MST-110588]|nr:hypothetical protein KGS77_28810 [Streptomyces sp. MST-110588]
MTPPPPQPPPGPDRRPYGSVRLPAPVAVRPLTRRPAGPAPSGRWYGPRVPLPPLSIVTLRRTTP